MPKRDALNGAWSAPPIERVGGKQPAKHPIRVHHCFNLHARVGPVLFRVMDPKANMPAGYPGSTLILITYRDCLTETAVQRCPAMCDQLAPCRSGIAQSSPRKRVTSALTHWPH